VLNSPPESSNASLTPDLQADALARLLSQAERESAVPPAREGLPSGYRMRADRHYVEQLDAPLARPPVTPPTPAPAPSERVDVDAELGNVVAVLGSCVNLLAQAPSSVAHAVSLDLMRAEIWRASCLLQAARVLRGSATTVWTPVAAAALFERVLDESDVECRLRNIRRSAHMTIAPGVVIDADVNQLVTALCGLLSATLTLVAGAPGTEVVCTVMPDGDRAVAFVVEQHAVTPAAPWAERAFDASWTARPGGDAERIWLLATRSIAERHNAHVAAETLPRGTSLRLTIPVRVSAP